MQSTKWVHEALWVPKVKVVHWPWSKSLRFNILNCFSSITTRPIEDKFHVDPPWDGGTILILLGMGERYLFKWSRSHDQDGHHALIWMGPLQIFFSGTLKPMTLKLGMQHWVLEYYQACANGAPGWTLTYLTTSQIWSPMLLYGKKLKQWIGRWSQLKWVHEALWVPRVKVIHWPWSKLLRFNIFKLLFLNNPWF